MTIVRCLVVDDEELARALIVSYINKLDFLELVGTAENPVEAMQIMHKQPVDLLFLDIQMPELKGTDFAKTLESTTKIIFTTAYTEYALQGYELNAVDYLLKPITFERFLMAVNKLKDNTTSKTQKSSSITVKSGYHLHIVEYDDILYMESDSEYVTFYTSNKKIISNQRLKNLEVMLPEDQFLRVHRSYIVNRKKVTGLKSRELLLSEIKIPVSDSYFEMVKEQLF